MAAWAVGSLIANALLQVLPVLLLGASRETDAFLLLLTPSAVVFAIAAGAFPNVETPRLAAQLREGNGESLEQQRHWIGLAAGAVVVSLSPAPALLVLYDRAPLNALDSLTALAIVSLGAVGCGANVVGLGVTCLLNAKGQHVEAVRLNTLAALIGLTVGLVLVPSVGVLGASLALVTRGAVYGLKIGALTAGGHSEMSAIAVAKSARHLIGSNALFRSEILIDRALAVTMAPGALSVYYVLTRGYGSASQVVNHAVNVPLLTTLASMRGSPSSSWSGLYRRHVGMAAVFGAGVFAVGATVAVLTPGLLTGGEQTDVPVRALALSLIGYAVLGCVGQVAPSALYAMGWSTTVARLSVIAFALGAGLKLSAGAWFGVVGLGAATSAYHVIGLSLTLMATRRLIRMTR